MIIIIGITGLSALLEGISKKVATLVGVDIIVLKVLAAKNLISVSFRCVILASVLRGARVLIVGAVEDNTICLGKTSIGSRCEVVFEVAVGRHRRVEFFHGGTNTWAYTVAGISIIEFVTSKGTALEGSSIDCIDIGGIEVVTAQNVVHMVFRGDVRLAI